MNSFDDNEDDLDDKEDESDDNRILKNESSQTLDHKKKSYIEIEEDPNTLKEMNFIEKSPKGRFGRV